MPNIDISILSALPIHMADIQILWRKNSKTLGFFPGGAFEDAISKGGILVALIGNTLVGYLLFRQSRERVTIVHLCIHEAYQRQGVARELVKALAAQTQAALGIGLKCRTDFSVNAMWPHLGFVARNELEGRNVQRKPLTYWWKSNGVLSLESLWIEETLAGKIAVVLDANVFFDLEGAEETQRSEESKALLADWLQDSIELCLTPEIFNEVHRRADPLQREQNRAAISRYISIESDPQIFERSLEQLTPLFSEPTRESDSSDLRQIAHAAAAKVPFFVTRDDNILERENPIYESTGVRVLRPATLIIHLDELQRETEYRPAQFAATDIECQRIGQHDLDGKEELFQRSAQENKAVLQAQLNGLLSRPNEVNSLRVFNDTQGELGILFTTLDGDSLKVPMIRVREISSAPSSAPTIARSLSSRLIKMAVKSQSRLVLIVDPHISPIMESAFLEDGFFKTDHGLLRYMLPNIGSSQELVDFAKETGERNSWISENDQVRVTRLMEANLISAPKQALLAEDSLWPTRVSDAFLNTYIVPIRPHWAKELFDEGLASQTIFGSITKLLLNRESVYYRSARPSGIKAPARILWYVSQDKNFQNVGSIRACSSLQEVHVGSAKTLFSQFRRLGVFQWSDLMDVTENQAEGKLMALKFGSTFNFQSPVPWADFQKILEKHGCKGPIQSPHPITNEAFVEIFSAGA